MERTPLRIDAAQLERRICYSAVPADFNDAVDVEAEDLADLDLALQALFEDTESTDAQLRNATMAQLVDDPVGSLDEASNGQLSDDARLLDSGPLKWNPIQQEWQAQGVLSATPAVSADAASLYTMQEGDALTLDASATTGGSGLNYGWDLNDDDDYGDASGVSPTLSWTELNALGIDDDGTYVISLEVTDGSSTDYATATLTITNVEPIIVVSGDTTVTAGNAYEISFSATDPGNDPVLSWNIDWGDGTFETVHGALGSSLHRYTTPGMSHGIVVTAVQDDGAFSNATLLVSGEGSDAIHRFSNDGTLILPSLADDGSVTDHRFSVLGPDGRLYVDGGSNNVVRYHPATGSLIDEFIPNTAGIVTASGLAFGPDGNVYVASADTNEVLRFDGTTGEFLDAFIAPSSTLNRPEGIEFGPDGYLYVADFNENRIVRFDGLTGARVEESGFVTAGSGGLSNPTDIAFGGDGFLYVASRGTDQVLRYSLVDGSFDSVVLDGASGLNDPSSLTVGPNQQLYVTNLLGDTVVRSDLGGADASTFLTDPTGNATAATWRPTSLLFLPDHRVQVIAPASTTPSLTLATADSAGPGSGVDGVDAWSDGTGIRMTDMMLEPAGTSGSFSIDFDLDAFATNGTTAIESLHYVSSDLTIGEAQTVALQTGDLIFSTEDPELLIGSDLVTVLVDDRDVVVFRPDSLNDYSSGTFFTLLNDPINASIRALTLVQQDTRIGDTRVRAGDLLIAGDADSTIRRVDVSEPGVGSTVTTSDLFDADQVGVTTAWEAIDLVEIDMSLGDIAVAAGQLLLANSADITPATDTYSVHDLVALTVSQTQPGSGVSDGTFQHVLQGTDVGFDATEEAFDAVTLGTPERTEAVPDVTNTTQWVSYIEDQPEVDLDDMVVTDSDSTTVTATLRLNDPSAGSLSTDTGLGESYDATTGIWQMTGSPTDVSTALADAVFAPAENYETDTTVTVWVQDDTGALAPSGLITLDVTPQNDIPSFTPVSQTRSYVEDDPTVDLDDIVVSDPDDGDLISVTLTLDDPDTGTITTNSGHGETYSTSGIWSVSGTVDEVNAALADATFVPAADNDLDTEIQVSVTDTTGPAQIGSIQLDVTPVNDSPVNVGRMPSQLGVMEDTRSTLVLTYIELDDVDSTTESLTVTLQTTSGGTLFAPSQNGVTVTGSSSTTLTLQGDLAAINSYLDAYDVEYLSVLNAYGAGADAIRVSVFDTNLDGSTGPTVELGTIELIIYPVNDAPVAANDQYQATSGEPLIVLAPGVLANDHDVEEDPLRSRLVRAPSHGILIFGSNGSIKYQADADFQGVDTFTYLAHDGTATSNEVTVSIDVTASPPPPDPTPTPTPDEPSDDAPSDSTSTEQPVIEAPPDDVPDSQAPTFDVQREENSLGGQQIAGAGQELVVLRITPTIDAESSQTAQFSEAERIRTSLSSPTTDDTFRESLTMVTDDAYFVAQAGPLWQELDMLSVQIAESDEVQLLTPSSVVFTSAFTVGYVVWLLRAGQLLTSILAQMPAWHLIDPLPVLNHLGGLDDDDDDETLQSIIDKGTAVSR